MDIHGVADTEAKYVSSSGAFVAASCTSSTDARADERFRPG
jgi:hypothetical protein